MRHEKIIKRSDGSKINITVYFYRVSYTNEFEYTTTVYVCQSKKRKFTEVNDNDASTWRKLSFEERKQYNDLENLKYVSAEEIQTAKEELWQLLKP